MSQRIDYGKDYPDAMRGLLRTEKYIQHSSLDTTLYHLVKIRASQINQCAYCIDMHTKDARHKGETEQRIYALSAWRETSFFRKRKSCPRMGGSADADSGKRSAGRSV